MQHNARPAPTAGDLEEVFQERLHVSWTRSTAPYSNFNYSAASVYAEEHTEEHAAEVPFEEQGFFWTGFQLCVDDRRSGGTRGRGCDLREQVIVDRTPTDSEYCNNKGIAEHDLDGDGVLSRDELKAQRASRLRMVAISEEDHRDGMPIVDGMPYKADSFEAEGIVFKDVLTVPAHRREQASTFGGLGEGGYLPGEQFEAAPHRQGVKSVFCGVQERDRPQAQPDRPHAQYKCPHAQYERPRAQPSIISWICAPQRDPPNRQEYQPASRLATT